MQGQSGFWDVEDRLKELSAEGDPLEKLSATVDFEMFRPVLRRRWAADPGEGWPSGFDPVLKFRMLVLQAMHGLSLAQTEYLVRDRLSWMRFCGLGPGDVVPDANTLWDFREALIAGQGAGEAVRAAGRGDQRRRATCRWRGQIVDATLVAAPEAAQHRGREGRHQGGRDPARPGRTSRPSSPEGPRRALDGEVRQGQADGGRASRRSTSPSRVFGYKSHISIDRRHGVIRRQQGHRCGGP